MTASEKIDAKLSPIVEDVICTLLYFFSKISGQKKIPILGYHSVDKNSAFYNVDPTQFCRQMEYLKRNYNVVSLDEIVDFAKGGKGLPDKAAAITFDDGYCNNYLNAYPCLRKHRLPATIFLATGYIEKQMHLNRIPLEMLHWDTIIKMSKNNVTFGAHTINHPHLTHLDLNTARNEILESKEEIEKRTGKKVKYIATPYGEVNDEIVRLARSLGFECVFAKGSDLAPIQNAAKSFIIGRTDVNSRVTFRMFKVRLTTAIDWYAKLERAVRKIIRRLLFSSIANEQATQT